MDGKELARLDALAKQLVEGLPIDASVTYEEHGDYLTVDVRSIKDEAAGRGGVARAHAYKATSTEQNERTVRQHIEEFLSRTGPWRL